jgi:dTDP-4-dehydrorhamnose reductase
LDSSRFVIIGANGQLGTALKLRYPEARAVDAAELDITDAEAVTNFDWSEASVILNAAAYTNVDGAELPEGRVLAWKVNTEGVANLARTAINHSLTLIHISSEYVFDGTKSPHTEHEPLSPLGVYAQTKAAGDIAALIHKKSYILRTSWVIGEGKNFVRTMIGLAGKDISPTVVDDQIGRLTFTSTLVDAIDHLIKTEAEFGVYNVSNDGEPASWADVTRVIFQELGRDNLAVTGISTDAYFADKPEAAPRPLMSTMDLQKIRSTGLSLHDWRDDLKEYVKNEINQEVK